MRRPILLTIAALMFCSGPAMAGNLEPPGPPTPTMKTLDGTISAWDRTLSTTGVDPCNTERFTCLSIHGLSSVRDNETGLVWLDRGQLGQYGGAAAFDSCIADGFRLPSAAELGTLFHHHTPTLDRQLPLGHPFYNVPMDMGAAGTGGATYLPTSDIRARIDTSGALRNEHVGFPVYRDPVPTEQQKCNTVFGQTSCTTYTVPPRIATPLSSYSHTVCVRGAE